MLAVVITAALWTWTGFKGLFLNLPVWAVFEFFYRARARQSLICPHCSFDPYLYKHDVKLAREKIEQHFAEKQKKEAEAAEAEAADNAKSDSKKP